MVKTYAYGFPRVGKNREFKKVTERYWKDGDDKSLNLSLFELKK